MVVLPCFFLFWGGECYDFYTQIDYFCHDCGIVHRCIVCNAKRFLGAYQIRIATSLYALAYAFPFLVIPMGIGNLISNFLFGGLGIFDMVGGFGVGVVTTGIIVGMRKLGLSAWWAMLPIVFVPALFVPLWLSPLLGLPYWPLVLNLIVVKPFQRFLVLYWWKP